MAAVCVGGRLIKTTARIDHLSWQKVAGGFSKQPAQTLA